uniref:Uncharacterized protein n=1 Tax=Timema genevievae TaxID=629358 RepID=A0A7R9JRD8_TIMGE|nr:unnamed protein product [Timema genevievae]
MFTQDYSLNRPGYLSLPQGGEEEEEGNIIYTCVGTPNQGPCDSHRRSLAQSGRPLKNLATMTEPDTRRSATITHPSRDMSAPGSPRVSYETSGFLPRHDYSIASYTRPLSALDRPQETAEDGEIEVRISVRYMKKLNNELVSWSQLGAERRSNKKKAKLDLARSTLELNLANCHEFLTDDDKRSMSMAVDCQDVLKTYEDMKDMAAVNAHLKHKMKHGTKILLDRVDAVIAVTKADICHKDDPD